MAIEKTLASVDKNLERLEPSYIAAREYKMAQQGSEGTAGRVEQGLDA